MKTLLLTLLLAAPLDAATLAIAPLTHPRGPRVAVASGGGFSVDLPIVGRVHGVSTTFFTSLEVTNNTAQPTDVEFTYQPADGSAIRSGILGTLNGFDNLHIDDFLQSLTDAGILTPAQSSGTFGTLLLTFTNPSFTTGNEATAVARIYSIASGSGTYGLAYRAPALRTNGSHSLSSVLRGNGGIVTNLGIENVGIDDDGSADANPVTVRLTFYDTNTGSIIGAQPQYVLAPGQVMQLNNVAAQSTIVFVDEIAGNAQVRGYVVMKDAATNDGSFVFMQEARTAQF